MRRNLLLIILALFISFALSNQVFAYEDDYVKIALKSPLKSNYAVNLSSEGFCIGVWEGNFKALFNLNEKKLVASAVRGSFYIRTNKVFYSYDEAFYEVENFKKMNMNAFIYYNQSAFEVWIGQFPSESMALEEADKYGKYFNGLTDIVKDNKNRITLSNINNEIVLMFEKNQDIHLSSLLPQGEGLIKVEDSSYRDFITFSRKEDELIVINHVKIQHYLYGVVPKEMFSGWPLEALKAQAIAAKNYTLLNLNKHSAEGYGLCDTQHCQVYGGYNSENIMTNRAVDETNGSVLMYDNKLVNTFYHSYSGGYTEDSENVWSNAIPYLRGVKDDFSLGSPYDSWQFAISEEEIRNKLIEIGLDVGYITDVQVTSVSPNGRVLELMIKGTIRTEVLKKERTRQVFGASNIKSTLFEVKFYGENGNYSLQDIYIYNMSNGNIVKQSIDNATVLTSEGLYTLDSTAASKGIKVTDGSNNYEISNKIQNNNSDNVGKYVFSGKGWGHGVGMSQWGAKKMAELGYNYIQILEYYYTGAKVK